MKVLSKRVEKLLFNKIERYMKGALSKNSLQEYCRPYKHYFPLTLKDGDEEHMFEGGVMFRYTKSSSRIRTLRLINNGSDWMIYPNNVI